VSFCPISSGSARLCYFPKFKKLSKIEIKNQPFKVEGHCNVQVISPLIFATFSCPNGLYGKENYDQNQHEKSVA